MRYVAVVLSQSPGILYVLIFIKLHMPA